MRIIFYRKPSGQEPVRDYLLGLPLRDRAATADVLDAIRGYGLYAPGVRFKQIRGKLWEFYIEARSLPSYLLCSNDWPNDGSSS